MPLGTLTEPSAHPGRHSACVSPVSRLCLACVSPVSRLYLACVSPVSRLYLACIPQVILDEARESYKEEIVIELTSDSIEALEMNVRLLTY